MDHTRCHKQRLPPGISHLGRQHISPAGDHAPWPNSPVLSIFGAERCGSRQHRGGITVDRAAAHFHPLLSKLNPGRWASHPAERWVRNKALGTVSHAFDWMTTASPTWLPGWSTALAWISQPFSGQLTLRKQLLRDGRCNRWLYRAAGTDHARPNLTAPRRQAGGLDPTTCAGVENPLLALVPGVEGARARRSPGLRILDAPSGHPRSVPGAASRREGQQSKGGRRSLAERRPPGRCRIRCKASWPAPARSSFSAV